MNEDYAAGKAEIKAFCKTIISYHGRIGRGTGNSCNYI